MGLFLTFVHFSVLVFLSLRQILKNLYGHEPVEESAKWTASFLLSGSVSLLSCLIERDALPLYLALDLAGIYHISSSVIPFSWSKTVSVASVSVQALLSVFLLVNRLMLHAALPSVLFSYMAVTVCCMTAMLFLYAIYSRLNDIKVVLSSGSVWSMVCLSVDSVYTVMILLAAIVMNVSGLTLSSLILVSMVAALCVRVRNSSVFVFRVNLERRIVESMKGSQVDFAGESPGTDQLYKNIYERLLGYFETHRPYLNNELTINDIVDVVFTNKLYISKAISHCTGRNFCQFVNYYRVTYAVELFREDPQLKVVDLSSRSGFNTTNSFTAAFKLYMGEKPGDWCRKERARLTTRNS